MLTATHTLLLKTTGITPDKVREDLRCRVKDAVAMLVAAGGERRHGRFVHKTVPHGTFKC